MPPSLLALFRRTDHRRDGRGLLGASSRWALIPDQFHGLGRRGRVALPGSGQPGRRLAQLHGRGRVGHVAAPDPAFRAPFSVRDDQPGTGFAWTQPGGRRRAAWCGGRVSGGTDLAVDRRCAGSVAGLDRLVSRAGARPGWKCAARRRMPGPGPGPGRHTEIGGAAGGSGGRRDRDALPVRAPLDLAWLAAQTGERKVKIAPDDRDRSARRRAHRTGRTAQTNLE